MVQLNREFTDMPRKRGFSLKNFLPDLDAFAGMIDISQLQNHSAPLAGGEFRVSLHRGGRFGNRI